MLYVNVTINNQQKMNKRGLLRCIRTIKPCYYNTQRCILTQLKLHYVCLILTFLLEPFNKVNMVNMNPKWGAFFVKFERNFSNENGRKAALISTWINHFNSQYAIVSTQHCWFEQTELDNVSSLSRIAFICIAIYYCWFQSKLNKRNYWLNVNWVRTIHELYRNVWQD